MEALEARNATGLAPEFRIWNHGEAPQVQETGRTFKQEVAASLSRPSVPGCSVGAKDARSGLLPVHAIAEN